MQSWEGLDAFVAVAETGNFTRAASRLGVSISQVSREINRLEERLGTQILLRNTRRVALTENGRLFERRCRQLIDDREAALFRHFRQRRDQGADARRGKEKFSIT